MKRAKSNAAATLNKPLRRRKYLLGDPERTRAAVRTATTLLLLLLLVTLPLALPILAILWVCVVIIRVRRSGALFTAAIGLVAFLVAGGPQASLHRWWTGPMALATFTRQIITDKKTPVDTAWHTATDGKLWLWLLGQLPIALIVGGLLAWWLTWLRWLHTDEWTVPELRKGLLARFRQRRLVKQITAGRLVSTPDAAVMGINVATGGRLDLYDEERLGHVLVVGANGSGKSTTLFKLYEADLDRGRPVIMTDLKGLPEDRQRIEGAAAAYTVPCVTFTLDGGAWWDPFRSLGEASAQWWDLGRIGDRGERSNLLIASHNFGTGPTSDYYRTASKEFVDIALDVLDATPHLPYESTLETLIELAAMDRLTQRGSQVPLPDPTDTTATAAYAQLNGRLAGLLAKVNSDKDVLNGFLSGLSAMAFSAAGRHLRRPLRPHESTETRGGVTYIEGLPVLELATIRRANAVALFSFNKSRDGDMTARLGRLAVANQITMFGQMAEQGDMRRTLSVVDEFSALEADTTKELMVRGRGAGADVVLATQAIEDMQLAADSEAAIGRMLSNVNVIIAHRIGDRKAAERVAAAAGTKRGITRRYASEESQSAITADRGGTTGGTYADEDPNTPEVLPGVLQDLAPGQWVLIARSGRYGKRVVQQARTIINQGTIPAHPAAIAGTDPVLPRASAAQPLKKAGPVAAPTQSWGEEPPPPALPLQPLAASTNPFLIAAPSTGTAPSSPAGPRTHHHASEIVEPWDADDEEPPPPLRPAGRRPPPMSSSTAFIGLTQLLDEQEPPPEPATQRPAKPPAVPIAAASAPPPPRRPMSRLAGANSAATHSAPTSPNTPAPTTPAGSHPVTRLATATAARSGPQPSASPSATGSSAPIPPMPGTAAARPPATPQQQHVPDPQDSPPVVTFGQIKKGVKRKPARNRDAP